MSIAEKLTAIAENEQRVYDSGYSKAESDFWDGVQDSELPVLNFVGKDNKWEKTEKVKVCMSNSFAFGGANSCLIIGVK